MKSNTINLSKFVFLCFFILGSISLFADTHYVSKTGAHVSPFTSWASAATNIQAAVDAASESDTVLVNDGTYYSVNSIVLKGNIILKSVNGAENTIVDGSNTNSCFILRSEYLSSPIIDGFTITNGIRLIVLVVACVAILAGKFKTA